MDAIERQHWDTYANNVKMILDDIDLQDKTLLEIAPGECNYANIYSNAGLDKYIGVEPNNQWLKNAQAKIEFVNAAKQYEFVNKTFEEYHCSEQIDIVFCAGLMYHLASPFQLLETLANYNAEYIILEHTGALYDPHTGPLFIDEIISNKHGGGLTHEHTNFPGMRLTNHYDIVEHDTQNHTDKKFIPLNMFVSCDLASWCMEQMGYPLAGYNNIETGTQSKHQNCVMVFKRIRGEK